MFCDSKKLLKPQSAMPIAGWYVYGTMRGEMLEWLSTNPAPRGDNRLGFDQERTGDLSFTRRLWLEFDDRNDALLFRHTWDYQTTA